MSSTATKGGSRAAARGIQRVVSPTGEVSYKAQVRRQGAPREARRFATLADAVRWKRAREAEIDRGEIVDRREVARHTLAGLFKRYREEISPGKRGAAIEECRLQGLERDALGRINAALVKPQHVYEWMARRSAVVGSSTVNRELNLISHVFTKARKAWGLAVENPVHDVERPKQPPPRDRRLSRAEVDAICRASSSTELPVVLRLAAESGMRRGEIMAMRWEHVDLEARLVKLPTTKNGEPRVVPLSRSAVTILEALPKPPEAECGALFSTQPHSMSRAMNRAVARARQAYEAECAARGEKPTPDFITGAWIHSARHEAISRLVEAGVPQLTTMRIVGHKSVTMTNRYYTAQRDHLLAAVDAMEGCAR